jgi:hypothetical protein
MRERFSRVLLVSASLLVLSALLFFVSTSDPPENSVEWHKEHYLKLFNKRAGKTLPARCARVWRRLTGAPLVQPSDIRKYTALSLELDRHRDALVHMKYLTERNILLTNAPAQAVILRAHRKAQTLIPKVRMQLTNFSAYDPNGIVVIVTAHAVDMPALEKIVRDSDTP